jgi:uncharacterized protein (DUF2252 family)
VSTNRVQHPTVAERVAAGRRRRTEVPRSAHAGWSPPGDRPDPVALLEAQAVSRVPELVPIRYGRMLSSPFAFYRGAASVMSSDLAGTPASGLRAQLCGDAHLSNFGLFASAERSLLFDLNDFDETLPGPWEWDVKRLAASIAIAGRELGHAEPDRAEAVLQTAAGYRSAMREFSEMGNLEVFYARLDVDQVLSGPAGELTGRMRKRLETTAGKARTSDSTKALRKLTEVVGGERRFVSDPPLIERLADLVAPEDASEVEHALRGALRSYRARLLPDRRFALEGFRVVDVARKVVGVGSVGTRAWVVLLLGRDENDPLILQFKEAQASVLAPFAGASRARSHGQRVVEGQRLMQASTDIFLGSMQLDVPGQAVRRDFYARQLKDWKGSFELEGARPAGLALYGRMCGWTLARAHARSGDRIAIGAYLGRGDGFERAMVSFAEDYAEQNERDHAALAEAARAGRIAVIENV